MKLRPITKNRFPRKITSIPGDTEKLDLVGKPNTDTTAGLHASVELISLNTFLMTPLCLIASIADK